MTTELLERPVAERRPAPDDDESVPPGELGRDVDSPDTGPARTDQPVGDPGEGDGAGPSQPGEPHEEDTTPDSDTAPIQPGE
jgi:hypothetical protein